jgi:hypothetical protein
MFELADVRWLNTLNEIERFQAYPFWAYIPIQSVNDIVLYPWQRFGVYEPWPILGPTMLYTDKACTKLLLQQ